MATTLFPQSGSVVSARQTHGTNRAKLNGSTSAWQPMSMLTTRGAGAASIGATTVTGPTSGIEFVSGLPVEWYSPPLAADVTIAGTITLNLRASEGDMNANAAVNAIIERVDHLGAVISTIAQTARVTELGTSEGAANFTVTPTSTAMNKGDRLRLRVYIDDAGTMGAAGASCFFWFNGPTGGASGDSFITFTETFSFITTDPTGSQVFLTNTASDVATASVDREAWTSRGAGVQNDVTNTAAGWTSPIQITDTAGGTVVDWFTKPLAAMTLSGAVLVNLRALQTNSTAANSTLRAEIARVDEDGTNAVVYGATNRISELTGTEGVQQVYVMGDDLAITDGQRIRIRVYIDDAVTESIGMVSGHTVTFFYAGTSGGASGDSWVTFTQTLTEFAPTTVEATFTADAVIKKTIAASFTIDAFIAAPGQGQFTANAVLRRIQSASFTADAAIKRTPTAALTADAIIKKTIVHGQGPYFEEYTNGGAQNQTYHQALVYLNAADGTPDITGGGGNDPVVGQAFNFGGGGFYFVGQMMTRWDLSGIPADAVIISARIWLDGIGDNSNVDFDLQARKSDFGASLTSTDFRTATQLAALPLLGSMNTSAWIFDTNVNTRQWNIIDIDPDEVDIGGFFDVVFCSSRQVSKTAPAATTAGDEFVEPSSDFGGEGPMLELVFSQGDPLTFDAVIAKWYEFTANAIIKRTQPFSFTADAVIVAGGATHQFGLNADAIIRRSTTASFTADAWLRRIQSATFTADAVIIRRPTATFTVDAWLKRNQTASFTIDAWIYAPREDPDGPGEPGETPLVSILVDGVDVTRDVVLSDATFTMLVNGAIGTFRFRIRDDDHVYNVTSGAEVTLDIDGKRKFGGYALQPKRLYAFPVEDTTVPSRPSRFVVLEGVDYNILMTKRVVYDHDNPENVELRRWPEDSDDDDVIRYVFTNYTDLAADGVTLDGVTHVGSPNPDKPGVVASGGLRFVDAMREINRLISGVFYIDPFKVLHFVDVDTPDAFFGLSDVPDVGDVGYRELEQVENGTGLVNDAMVWGAGMGSNRVAFSRVQDATSIAAHRRWQFGEYTTAMFRQASVDMRADTIVNGTPQSKRGGKDDQESWTLVSYEKSFAVGQKVEIDSAVFGKADVVPIRRLTITFPTKKKPKFSMVLSHEIDEPWNIFEFWFPKFSPWMPDFDVDIPDGEGGGESGSECDTPFPGLGTDEDWTQVVGFGDGLSDRYGLTPGWDVTGNTLTLRVAADAIDLPPDRVAIRLSRSSFPELFAWLAGGPFVMSGSLTLPNVDHNDRSASVTLGVFFDPDFGSDQGLVWSYTLTGDAGFPQTHNDLGLHNFAPSDAVSLPEVVVPGTFAWSFRVHPMGGTIDVGGNSLTLTNDALGPFDWSNIADIQLDLGESGSAGDEGVIEGGTYSITLLQFQRVDGTPAPWCATFQQPDGQGRDNFVGDGVITTFQLRSPYVPMSTRVFVGGYFQRPGIEYTEDPATGQITFVTAPASPETVTVFYHAVVGEF